MPKGPFKLVTVNNVPERAKRLIGRVVDELKDQYTIEHVANCASRPPGTPPTWLILTCAGKEEVVPTVTRIQPDILVSPHASN